MFSSWTFWSDTKKKKVDEVDKIDEVDEEKVVLDKETKDIESELKDVEKTNSQLKLELKENEEKEEKEEKEFLDIIGMSPRSISSENELDYLVYDDDSDDENNEVNECGEIIQSWSKKKKYRIQRCLWKLKYNRIISFFYLDSLKRKETKWSWRIIEISTLTSGLTVANNVDEEPFKNYKIVIQVCLTILSMGTSLIAAWMKKQGFVEKINEIDKYLININSICEEIEIQLMLLDKDRLPYKEFKDKFLPEITKYVSSNPMISPKDWKDCAKEITLKYPQLIEPDNNEENKLWPWYGDLVQVPGGEERFVRRPTKFMNHMLRKDKRSKIKSSCCFDVDRPVLTVYK